MRGPAVFALFFAVGCGSRAAPLPELVPSVSASAGSATAPSGTASIADPAPPPRAGLPEDDASCSYDVASMRCVDGAGGHEAGRGPTCARGAGRSGCVVTGFVGKVTCAKSGDCSCTSGYTPAPAKLFPPGAARAATATTGARPGDCVATCRAGRCEATQAPM